MNGTGYGNGDDGKEDNDLVTELANLEAGFIEALAYRM